MKTRLLIIIGIILASVVLISSVYVVSVQNRCESLLGDTHYPRPLTLWNCFDYLQMIDYPPEPINTSIPEPEPTFEKEEQFTKIEIIFGERLIDKLVPVTFTEVTTNAETLDEIIVWNFQLIDNSAGNLRIVWDALPKDKRISYEITDDDGLDIRIPEDFILIPFDLHGYKMDCGLFQTVTGESAHPTLFKIKNNTSTIYAQNSRIGIYPDSNGEYSFEFASIFKNYVSFPEDAVEIISQNTRECKLTNNVEDDLTGKYTDGYYTKMTFRLN